MGLAWGANPSLDLTSMVVLIVLSFTIINLSSAIGAQVNTISDYELDSKDHRKKELVQAYDGFGHNRLRNLLIGELAATLVLVTIFMLANARPILLPMWIVGISLGYLYSAPPLRIKARSWLAPVTLILVLGVFPVLFAYFTFTSELDPIFLVALTGLALTIYGVIIPTEIRDYFGDREMNIETMTVHLGLGQASLLSILLLSLGGIFIGAAFYIKFIHGQYPLLSLLVVTIVVADLIVLQKFVRLYRLSNEYENSSNDKSLEQEITSFSSNNPKWIMLVTQTYSFISIIMLLSKFLH
jgi:4-hydroxybenzoate polyprenyltransferase